MHTRSFIPYGVFCLRFLILATLKFLQPAIRGTRGPSTDAVLNVEDSQRTDSCTVVWLIPCIMDPNESPKDSKFNKLNQDWKKVRESCVFVCVCVGGGS